MVLLRRLWAEAKSGWDLAVDSAGTATVSGLPATDHAISVMKDQGLDLTGHRSQPLPDLDGYDLVLTMTRSHRDSILALNPDLKGRVFTVGEYAGTGEEIPDPYGGPRSSYTTAAQALTQTLKAVVARIRTEGRAEE